MIGAAGDAEAAAMLVAELGRAGFDAEASVRSFRDLAELRSIVEGSPVDRRPILVVSRHTMAALGSLVGLDEVLSMRRSDATAVKSTLVTGPDEAEEAAREVARVRGALPIPEFVAALTAKPLVSEEAWEAATKEVGAESRQVGDVARLVLYLLVAVIGLCRDPMGRDSWRFAVLGIAALVAIVVAVRDSNAGRPRSSRAEVLFYAVLVMILLDWWRLQ